MTFVFSLNLHYRDGGGGGGRPGKADAEAVGAAFHHIVSETQQRIGDIKKDLETDFETVDVQRENRMKVDRKLLVALGLPAGKTDTTLSMPPQEPRREAAASAQTSKSQDQMLQDREVTLPPRKCYCPILNPSFLRISKKKITIFTILYIFWKIS